MLAGLLVPLPKFGDMVLLSRFSGGGGKGRSELRCLASLITCPGAMARLCERDGRKMGSEAAP